METIILLSDILVRILDTVVWPLTVIALSYFFRSEIKRIFERLSKFRYKGLEADFEKGLIQTEKIVKISARPLPKIESLGEIVESELGSTILSLLPVSPKSAIIFMWLFVEKAATEAAERSGIFIPPRFSGHQVFQLLNERSLLDDEFITVYRLLRNLRNKAVNMPEFTLGEEEAERYILLGLSIVEFLSQINNSA